MQKGIKLVLCFPQIGKSITRIRRHEMLAKYTCSLLIGVFLFLQGCRAFILNEDKRALREYRLHEQEYQPYKLLDTIEGYREFIEKHGAGGSGSSS